LRLFSFGGYGLALAALALVLFGAYDSYPNPKPSLQFPVDVQEEIPGSIIIIFIKENVFTEISFQI